MVADPSKNIILCEKYKAKEVIIHSEIKQPLKAMNLIRKNNMRAGIALNPSTDPEKVRNLIKIADFVLVLSVKPGLSGQRMIRNIVSLT